MNLNNAARMEMRHNAFQLLRLTALHDLINFLDDLKEWDIQFQSLTESIDTKTLTGRVMWQMIGILAELERSLIQERTKVGRDAAKARGVKMGRKPKLSPQQIKHAKNMIGQGESPATVAKLLNVARSTLYAHLLEKGKKSYQETGQAI